MKYFLIKPDCDPKITGVNNGMEQVETLYANNNYSLNEKQRTYLENFCKWNFKNNEGIYINDFKKNDIEYIKLFKTRKRVKEIDILEAGIQNSFGLLGNLYSKKAIEIIESYKLPPHHKIKVDVEGFKNEYYLLGFSKISQTEINFEKSTFKQSFNGVVKFNNYEEFRESPASFNEIYLLQDYSYDVILLGNYLFFSEKLINELENNKIVGYTISNITLNFE